MDQTTTIRGKGTIVIPKAIRDRLGLEEGTLVILQETGGALLIRPAIAVPIEVYDMRRKAELLLNNAVDAEDYARIVQEVKRMGFDPATIPHDRPQREGDDGGSGASSVS